METALFSLYSLYIQCSRDGGNGNSHTGEICGPWRQYDVATPRYVTHIYSWKSGTNSPFTNNGFMKRKTGPTTARHS